MIEAIKLRGNLRKQAQLTAGEVGIIRDVVLAPGYKHKPLGTPARARGFPSQQRKNRPPKPVTPDDRSPADAQEALSLTPVTCARRGDCVAYGVSGRLNALITEA